MEKFIYEIVDDELMSSIIQRKGYFFSLLYFLYHNTIYLKFTGSLIGWIYTEILSRVLPLLRIWLAIRRQTCVVVDRFFPPLF